MEDALFLYVRGFSHGVFTQLRVLTRHPGRLVFRVSTSLLFVAIHIVLSNTRSSLLSFSTALLLSFFPLHLPYKWKCQNVGRPGMTPEITPEVAPEMTPETLSGGQSLDELAREPSVYREPSTRDAVSALSSSLSIDIILTAGSTRRSGERPSCCSRG